MKKMNTAKLIKYVSLSGLVIVLAVSTLLFYLYDQNTKIDWREGDSSFVLGTVVRTDYFSTNNQFKEVNKEVAKKIQYYGKLFDSRGLYELNGEPFVNIKKINDHYGKGELKIEEDLFELIQFGVEQTKVTEGAFNIGIGALSNLWSSYTERIENISTDINHHVDPSFDLIQQGKSCVPDYKKIDQYVILNPSKQTIELKTLENCNYQMSLSVGAIAKGFIAKKISETLKEKNISGYVNAGSSSQSFFNNQIENTMKIVDPLKVQNRETAFELKIQPVDFSISVSGDYQQNSSYEIKLSDGSIVRRHHIVNPLTGYPSDQFRSTVVITNNSLYADLLTTTLMNKSLEEGKKLIKIFIDQGIEIDAYWLEEQSKQNLQIYALENHKHSKIVNEKYSVEQMNV